MMTRLLVVLFMLLSGVAHAADCSGTMAAGGAAQDAFQATNTRSVIFMNNSANVMCIAFDQTATLAGTNCGAGSYALTAGTATTAGGSFSNPTGFIVNRISVISASLGDRYSCTRQN